MANEIESLIDELERSYTEVRERLSDPSVYNDHREAADVGRRLKELEKPYKLAQEWRAMKEDVDASQADPELKELVAESETRLAELEEELKVALVEKDPNHPSGGVFNVFFHHWCCCAYHPAIFWAGFN